MRVALIDPSLFTLPYDSALAAGLTQGGHDVTLYGRKPRPEEGSADGVRLAPAFYRVTNTRLVDKLPGALRLGLKGLDHAWCMGALKRLFQRQPPDIIHFQWLPLPLLDGMMLDQFRAIAPLVLTVHDTNPFNGDPSTAIQSRGFGRCLDKFDRLVVHTAQGEARLRRMGIPAGRIATLPHGMLVDPVPGEADPMDGTLTFLQFGKIKPYKGADVLIKAFAAVPEQLRARAKVKIVGKPYMDLAPLYRLAEEQGFQVEIDPGYLTDEAVTELFSRPGTVAMFPYREIEASGVMFLAMAHGRPMIASRLGSFAEFVVDGEHGHLVPPDDVAALADAMVHMLTDRAFAASSAAAVRKLVLDVPGWDEIAQRTVATYRAAMATRPVPAPQFMTAGARG